MHGQKVITVTSEYLPPCACIIIMFALSRCVWSCYNNVWALEVTFLIRCGFKLRIIVEDIIDDMKMVIFHWPFTLLWRSDFLRFDDWKNPLAKVTVLVRLGTLLVPERRFRIFQIWTDLDRCRNAFPLTIVTFYNFLIKIVKKALHFPKNNWKCCVFH